MSLTTTNVMHTLIADAADAQSMAARGKVSELDAIKRDRAGKLAHNRARSLGYRKRSADALAIAAYHAWHRGESPEECALRCVRSPSESSTDPGAA